MSVGALPRRAPCFGWAPRLWRNRAESECLGYCTGIFPLSCLGGSMPLIDEVGHPIPVDAHLQWIPRRHDHRDLAAHERSTIPRHSARDSCPVGILTDAGEG